MKQRIEFYQKALKPSDNPATFGLLWRVCLLIVLLWGFVSAYVSIGYHQLQSEVAAKNYELERGEQNLVVLRTTLSELKSRQADDQLDLLQKNIRARQKLLDILKDRNLVSYANTLRDLALIPWQNVALQGLTLQDDRMVLRGEAAKASAVPAWILGFEQQDSLRGHAFSQLSIMQQPEGGLGFSLYSAER